MILVAAAGAAGAAVAAWAPPRQPSSTGPSTATAAIMRILSMAVPTSVPEIKERIVLRPWSGQITKSGPRALLAAASERTPVRRALFGIRLVQRLATLSRRHKARRTGYLGKARELGT